MNSIKHFTRLSLLLILFSFSLIASAQYSSVMSEDLMKSSISQSNLRTRGNTPIKMISILVQGDVDEIRDKVEDMGGKFKFAAGNIASVLVPKNRLGELATVKGVIRMESGPSVQLMNDTMVINNNVTEIRNIQSPLTQDYTGSGVLIGFLDSGIDPKHKDFRNDDGSSRIVAIWDQNIGSPTKSPPTFGYGQYWTKANIDEGSCTHIEGSPSSNFGHGTNISGIAAGNGKAVDKYAGVAPEASIAMVAVNLYQANADFLSEVADGVAFLFELADSLDLPCVINTSIGTYTGPRDATDLTSQVIDSLLLEKSGRALVASAGNKGDAQYHLGYTVTADTNFTLFATNSTYTYFKLYADTADFNNVEFAVGAYKVTPSWSRKGITAFSKITDGGNFLNDAYQTVALLDSESGATITTVYYWTELQGDKYYMSVYTVDNSSYMSDSATIQFSLHLTGDGEFDIWSKKSLQGNSSDIIVDIPAVEDFAEVAYYKLPDFDHTIVSSWQCSPNVITVGNYSNRRYFENANGDTTYASANTWPGKIHYSSSQGPTRTGVQKPEICASGDQTISTGDSLILADYLAGQGHKQGVGGKHQRNGGTSSASPVVAGAIAIYLQANPTASLADIRGALINTAKTDNYTGTVPNDAYGYGKLNAFNMLVSTLDTTCPFTVDFSFDTVCIGDTTRFINLSASSDTNRTINNYMWDIQNDGTNKDTTNGNFNGVYDSSGSYTVKLTVSDAICDKSTTKSGIIVNSNTISLGLDSMKCANDTIQLNGGNNADYVWSTGDSTSSINVVNSDTISLTVTDTNGCIAMDTIQINNFNTFDITLKDDTTICSDALISFTVDTPLFSTIIWDGTDTAVTKSYATNGAYYVEAIDSNNCMVRSSTFNLTVNNIPSFSIGNDTVICSGDTLKVASPDTFVSYLWNNTSQKMSTNYLKTGDVILTVVDSNTCTGIDSLSYSVYALPAIDLGSNVKVCPGDSAFLGSNLPDISYLWSTGETTDSIVVKTKGNYILTVVDGNTCSASDTVNFNFNTTDFELDLSTNSIGNSGVNFINETENIGDYSFKWLFGDGKSSILPHPSHTYLANGTFDITLIAISSSSGCSDTVIFEDWVTIGNLENCDHSAIISTKDSSKHCIGDSVLINAVADSNLTSTFNWIKDGEEISNETDRAIYAKSSGVYEIMMRYNDCITYSNSVSLSFSDSIPSIPIITSNGSLTNCSGSVVLSTDTNYSTYLWSDNNSTNSTTISSAGTYSVTVTNSESCTASNSIILSTENIASPVLCIFSFDTVSMKNRIHWTISSTTNVDSFVIFKEALERYTYNSIGSISSSSTDFIDSTSTPEERSDRYKVASKDNCAVIHEASDAHKTISTKLEVVNNKRTLSWSNYEGESFDQYMIYKGSHYVNLTLIDSVSSTTYSYEDTSTINEHAFYQIGINTIDDCNALNSRSNIVVDSVMSVNNQVNHLDDFFKLFPNPNTGQFRFQIRNLKEKSVKIEIYNLLGQKVQEEIITLQNGSANASINASELQSGLYFIRINLEDDIYNQSFVIKK